MFLRLDLKENCLCQHLQLLANPSGSTHEEAVRTTHVSSDRGPAEVERLPNNHISLASLSSPQRGHLGPEEASEELLQSLVAAMIEDENVVQLFSVQCCKVVLAFAVPGTLVLTKNAIAFTADDSSSEYENAMSMVSGEDDIRSIDTRLHLEKM